ncbi:hypothetical protein QEW_0721 [Clostridioides difficile CD160]|nr:hypothetical protein QEW_0721 [Clostridioides difficile CD160]
MKKKMIRIKKCECGGDIFKLSTKIGFIYQCKKCGEMYK